MLLTPNTQERDSHEYVASGSSPPEAKTQGPKRRDRVHGRADRRSGGPPPDSLRRGERARALSCYSIMLAHESILVVSRGLGNVIVVVFVTELSLAVPPFPVLNTSWNVPAFAALTPENEACPKY